MRKLAEELLNKEINRSPTPVKCAQLIYSKEFYNANENSTTVNLPIDYTPNELDDFLQNLDSGYFPKCIVWFEDNTWLELVSSSDDVYDSNYYWEYYKTPEIPKELL